jgi:L-serine dehydratase
VEECISVFDMLKIGVGPSSSHTLGPWRAAENFLRELDHWEHKSSIIRIQVDLYGSLALTGKGHATDKAIMLGLSGFDPVTIPIEQISTAIDRIHSILLLDLAGNQRIPFDPGRDIFYHKEFLPFHANGMRLTAFAEHSILTRTYFSIGGGFIVSEGDSREAKKDCPFPYPIQYADELVAYTRQTGKKISDIVWANEKSMRSEAEIKNRLLQIWQVMLECMYTGSHTEGILPGGLEVRRRAYDLHQKLMPSRAYTNAQEWFEKIRLTEVKFKQILKWVSCFALAVNEVNAALGRVVTAPTNGSAGVIPAVLMYYLVIENHQAGDEEIYRFLLVAGELGSIFKKGSTISAAMGGCQAEIGVSSAMAAGALCELLGGDPDQVLMAAEIAMEHHLGLTCDPVGGLVQIPCIERNTMGAIKAIHAAELAIESDAKNAKISLDKVIATMWHTAQDMNAKYKETSEGGLAIAVNLADC